MRGVLKILAVLYVFSGQFAFAQSQSISHTEFSTPDLNLTGNLDTELSMGEVVTAYNSLSHEYLIVWQEQTDATIGQKVYASRVSAIDGRVLTPKFLVSFPSGGEAAVRDAYVAYDPINNLYLVVWSPSNAVRAKVTGQFLNATTGEKVGNAFYIGNGFVDDPSAIAYTTEATKLIYNETLHEYLVTWIGTAHYGGYSKESEVFIAKVSPNGVVGTNTRVSYFGEAGSAFFKVHSPESAYNSVANEYLVIWGTFSHTGSEQDYYSQRFNGTTLAKAHPNNIVLVDFLNTTLNPGYMVPGIPSLVYNPVQNEYFALIESQYVITGYRLSGVDASKINRIEINRGLSFAIETEVEGSPVVKYRPGFNQYIVAFQGKKPRTEANPKPFTYLYGQLLSGGTGERIAVKNFRITQKPSDTHKKNLINSRSAPAISIDKDGNFFSAFIGSDFNEEERDYDNLHDKIFRPYLDERTFPEDDLPAPPPTELKASIFLISAAKGKYVLRSRCQTTPTKLEVPMTHKFFISKDTKFDKGKDKLKMTKRAKPGTVFLEVKLKKEPKMPPYVLLECSLNKKDAATAAIAPDLAPLKLSTSSGGGPHGAHRARN